jgi:prevent-host-death family protein
MASMGVRELRQNLSQALRRVRSGETIEVTDRGEPVARIVPVTYPTKLEQLVAEGKVTRPKGSLEEFLASHPPRPSTTGISASEALQEDRGD